MKSQAWFLLNSNTRNMISLWLQKLRSQFPYDKFGKLLKFLIIRHHINTCLFTIWELHDIIRIIVIHIQQVKKKLFISADQDFRRGWNFRSFLITKLFFIHTFYIKRFRASILWRYTACEICGYVKIINLLINIDVSGDFWKETCCLIELLSIAKIG